MEGSNAEEASAVEACATEDTCWVGNPSAEEDDTVQGIPSKEEGTVAYEAGPA